MFQDVEVLDLMILTRPTLLDGILRSLRAESHCSDSDGAVSPAELSWLFGETFTLSVKGTQSLGEISSVRIETVWLSETEISTYS